MPAISQNSNVTATFDAGEIRQLLIDAAAAAGAPIPDMGEVEDVIAATFQTTNMTSAINIDFVNNTQIVLTLVDREGAGTTPV